MIIRITDAKYAEELTLLDNLLFDESAYNLKQFLEMLQSQSYEIWIDYENQINAYAVIYRNVDFNELFKIGVKKEMRRKGLGKKLLQSIVHQYKNEPLLLEVSSKNEIAIAFYKDFGFLQNGLRKNYYGQGNDGVLMELK